MKEIIRTSNHSNKVVIGDNFKAMLNQLSFLSDQELDVLQNETIEIISKCDCLSIKPTFQTGLVVGYVQSGKTLSFTTVISLARDNRVKIVIVLAGTKNNLLHQTTSRLKKDLYKVDKRGFKIFENTADDQRESILNCLLSSRNKTLVFTVLKHAGRIDALSSVLSDKDVQNALGNNPVLVIDDEADQASLNTKARYNSRNNADEESRTFEAINNLRLTFSNHTLLQYTATPQGPLLIDIISSLSPEFYSVISPGQSYTGGNYFFKSNNNNIIEIPENEVFHHRTNPLRTPPDSYIHSLLSYFVSSTILFEYVSNVDVDLLSMMVHPSPRVDSIDLFYHWTQGIIDGWKEIINGSNSDTLYNEFSKDLESFFNHFGFVLSSDLAEFVELFYERLLETKVHKVTGSTLEVDWDFSDSHILIGGAKLDRGYTVNGLLTTYMPRHSLSTSNADTIQQRCRFFGYKKSYIEYCRVYLPYNSILEYEDYVDHEEYFRSLMNEIEPADFTKRLLLDTRLKPTRSSILSDSIIRSSLTGAISTSAVLHRESNSDVVNNFIALGHFKLSPDNGSTNDRMHTFSEYSIPDVLTFLYSFKMSNVDDINLVSLVIEYLAYSYDSVDLPQTCLIYHMAYKNQFRKRSINEKGKVLQLFSGPSTSGSSVYVGDRYIADSRKLSIQIHTLLMASADPELNNKRAYTLGFVFPTETSASFQGV